MGLGHTEACPLKLFLLSLVSENPQSEGICSERLWKAEAAEQGPAGQMAAGHRGCCGPTATCQLPGPRPHQSATRASSSSSGTGSPRCHPGTRPGPRSGRAAHTARLSHARLLLEGAEAEPRRAEWGDGQRPRMPSLSLEGSQGAGRQSQDTELRKHQGSGDRAWSAPFMFLCLCKRGCYQALLPLMGFHEDEMGMSTGALGIVLGRQSAQ